MASAISPIKLHNSNVHKYKYPAASLNRSGGGGLDVQPRNGLKSMLVKGKSLVWLGEAGLACDNYDNWWVEHPEDRSMPLLKNNFALCLLRDKNRREEAEGMFREALEASSVDDHVKKIGGNLELLKEWDGEGYFTGSLMW